MKILELKKGTLVGMQHDGNGLYIRDKVHSKANRDRKLVGDSNG